MGILPIILYFSLHLAQLVLGGKEKSSAPNGCKTYFMDPPHSSFFRVACIRTNLQDIPSDLDPNIMELQMMFNPNLKLIKNTALKNYPKLQKLDLSFNKIESVENGAFEHLKLMSLNLESNSLKKFDQRIPNCQKLVLYLNNNNQLTEFNIGTSKVSELHLANTNLTAFPNLGLSPTLQILDLSLNEGINNVTPDDLAPLCKLHTIMLPIFFRKNASNNCACHRLEAWMNKKHIGGMRSCFAFLKCTDTKFDFSKEEAIWKKCTDM